MGALIPPTSEGRGIVLSLLLQSFPEIWSERLNNSRLLTGAEQYQT